MNNIKEKYEFLKHFEKNNPILPEVKIRRFFSSCFFSIGFLLVISVLFIPSKMIVLQFGLNVFAIIFFFFSYKFSRKADKINLNINLKDLRTFLDWEWLFNSFFDFKNIEKLKKNFNPINFLDSKFKIDNSWRKKWKEEKILKENLENWVFLDNKIDLSTIEDKKIKTTLYDLFYELSLKNIPEEMKYPIFYEYVRNFGTKEQLEFIRKYFKNSVLLPELQNIKIIENIAYEKALRNLSFEGKTKNMEEVKKITKSAVKEYAGCDMEIEYRNVTQASKIFLEQILNKTEENVI